MLPATTSPTRCHEVSLPFSIYYCKVLFIFLDECASSGEIMYSLLHICCLRREDADAGVHPRTGDLFHSRNSIVTFFTYMYLLY
jgi:hypothetical protein